jgi:hypothetical protein
VEVEEKRLADLYDLIVTWEFPKLPKEKTGGL